MSDLTECAASLRRRGFDVKHVVNPGHGWLLEHAKAFDAVFVNVHAHPHQRIGTLRLSGHAAMQFWRAFWREHPTVIFTGFGNPDALYELPAAPNFYQVFGHCPASQEAAVEAWLGERNPTAQMPLRPRRLWVDPASLGFGSTIQSLPPGKPP